MDEGWSRLWQTKIPLSVAARLQQFQEAAGETDVSSWGGEGNFLRFPTKMRKLSFYVHSFLKNIYVY